jgi:hypothetical protein
MAASHQVEVLHLARNKLSLSQYKKLGKDDFFSGFQKSHKKKVNKYRNSKCVWVGQWKNESQTIKFDSKAERDHAVRLILLEKAGKISGLELQKRFMILPKTENERSLSIILDFYFFDEQEKRFFVHDVKSPYTQKEKSWVIKRKLFRYMHPEIELKEVIYGKIE